MTQKPTGESPGATDGRSAVDEISEAIKPKNDGGGGKDPPSAATAAAAHADDVHKKQDSSGHYSGGMPLYTPPRQRQRWGDHQQHPHTNWGDGEL